MTAPQLPHIFAEITGSVPRSYLDDNFNFLLEMILSQVSSPQISFSPPSLTAPVSAGTAAGTASVTGLSGGSWAISPTTYFVVNSTTGAITAATTVPSGSYTPMLTYGAVVGGQTVSVALQIGIVVPASGAPSFDFSAAPDSQYAQFPQGA